MGDAGYIFSTTPNSYFRGEDVRVEDTETHDVITVNIKDNMWAVEVKDDSTLADVPADVRHAIALLPEGMHEALYEEGRLDFWNGAKDLAKEHGFETVYQAGRSGGWMCVGGTEDWEPEELLTATGDELVQNFLKLAFGTIELIDGARSFYYNRIRECMGELQLELREYADWVGAEVQGLDGSVSKVVKLEIQYGRAALRGSDGLFTCANESKLVRKADGQVPARLTADPIMEQVFRIIEARGELRKDQIDTFLDADDNHDPAKLYEDEVSHCVDAIENQIEIWSHQNLGTEHG